MIIMIMYLNLPPRLTAPPPQIRIGELLFQPSMYGLEQGGIAATLQYVLRLFDAEVGRGA